MSQSITSYVHFGLGKKENDVETQEVKKKNMWWVLIGLGFVGRTEVLVAIYISLPLTLSSGYYLEEKVRTWHKL